MAAVKQRNSKNSGKITKLSAKFPYNYRAEIYQKADYFDTLTAAKAWLGKQKDTRVNAPDIHGDYGKRNSTGAGVRNAKAKNGPSTFYIIDKTGKAHGAAGTFDKLTNIADRHNENSDVRWYVVSEKDLAALWKKKLGHSGSIGKPERDIFDGGAMNPTSAKRRKLINDLVKLGVERAWANTLTERELIIAIRVYSTPPKRPSKKNSGVSEFKSFQKKRLAELSMMFQGHHNGESIRVMQPNSAPKVNKYLLGHLVQMKVRNGAKTNAINFKGEAYLSGDIRNNLWAVGKDARISNIKNPHSDKLQYLGKLVQIDYVTAKSHIEGGKTVRFWHPLGEVDKEFPDLYIDADGFPIIVGGGYDVWDVGIVN